MATEIERKFLVKRELWLAVRTPGVSYRQGYLARDGCTVRVRVAGDRAYLTIKGPTSGIERAEFEYPIPLDDAEAMLATLSVGPIIEKTRHTIQYAGREWVVDEFAGANAGLIMAEVELPSSDAHVVVPDWADREVSGDSRYHNASLSTNPYSSWSR